MSTEIIEKICTKCHKAHPGTKEYFVMHRRRKDGLHDWCKGCKNAHDQESRECIYCGSVFVASRRYNSKRTEVCSRRCFFLAKAKAINFRIGMLTILDVAEDEVKVINGETYKFAKYAVRCDCGKETRVTAGDITRRRKYKNVSCGCYRKYMLENGLLVGRGASHHNWKDGRTSGENKRYRWLHIPSHPNATSRGYVQEHIYIMSQFLGRRIRTEDGENIHHKNGQKRDNSILNLELWTHSQPHGQRAEDVLGWAETYIKQYKADVKKLAQLHEAPDSRQPALFT